MLRLYVFLLANVLLTDVFQVLPSPWLLVSAKDRLSWKDFKLEDSTPYGSFFKSTSPSIRQWENIDVDKHFSILSMQVDHHQESNWFMPSLHEKHSIGWNRTLDTGFGRRPYACTLRFFGVALESTLQDYVRGGSGFITLGFKREDNKQIWNGFDKNETKRIYCYYNTNKDTGSEFLDKPKTLGLAIFCPIRLDEEVGPHVFKSKMEDGSYCFPLAQFPVEVEMHLRPTDFNPNDTATNKAEIISEFITTPAKERKLQVQALRDSGAERPHAVCTVQSFKNMFTGSMLYFFIAYYQLMGWRVIVYDRFGMHYEYVKELLDLPGVDYYPFTVYELAQPKKYNPEYLARQGTDLKSFYKLEVNWGYSSKKIADTADQDADKTRTYDYARLEYAHLDTILFLDADELFYCPQAAESIAAQRQFHRELHHEFIARGIEEMRYVRIPYSGMAPPDFENTQASRAKTDFTNHTGHCMISAYEQRCLSCLTKCWSSGSSYDNFPKSADLAGVCPFHYNHWSCDGMKGGGRDFTKVRCRCKVGFDMQNGYQYYPVLRRCHLMHLNDNKYRFQSSRQKHVNDKGDVTQFSPLAALLKELDGVTNYTAYALEHQEQFKYPTHTVVVSKSDTASEASSSSNKATAHMGTATNNHIRRSSPRKQQH